MLGLKNGTALAAALLIAAACGGGTNQTIRPTQTAARASTAVTPAASAGQTAGATQGQPSAPASAPATAPDVATQPPATPLGPAPIGDGVLRVALSSPGRAQIRVWDEVAAQFEAAHEGVNVEMNYQED